MRLLAASLLLLVVRRRTCCCRSAPLREAQAIDPGLADLILVELRLPRTLLVLGYGAVLGVERRGAAGDVRQPPRLARHQRRLERSGAGSGGRRLLAGPDPTAGARRLRRGRGAWHAGAAGGLAGRKADTATLLLAGLAISLAAGAATSLALALAPSPFAFYDAFDWLMGSFADRSLAQAAAALDPGRHRHRRCSSAARERST